MTFEHGNFDLVLVCGPQTEGGRVIGNEEEVVGVMSRCLFLLGQTPLRESAFGATNNLARILAPEWVRIQVCDSHQPDRRQAALR